MPARPMANATYTMRSVASWRIRGATNARYTGARYERKMATATPVERMARKYMIRLNASETLIPSRRMGAPGLRRSRQLPLTRTTMPSAAAANAMRRQSSIVAGISA